MTTAYERVAALKLAHQQEAQREMKPEKIGQKVLREWMGDHLAILDPEMGADLVRRIAFVVKAERGITH